MNHDYKSTELRCKAIFRYESDSRKLLIPYQPRSIFGIGALTNPWRKESA